jgi:hypothetical protein
MTRHQETPPSQVRLPSDNPHAKKRKRDCLARLLFIQQEKTGTGSNCTQEDTMSACLLGTDYDLAPRDPARSLSVGATTITARG